MVFVKVCYNFKNERLRHERERHRLKTALRLAIIPATFWALLAPASYGFLFATVGDWSALLDVAIVLCCIALALSSFVRIPSALWAVCVLTVLMAVLSGQFHHFQDSGASGPLPFEWLNSYPAQGLPLLVLAGAQKISQKTSACINQPT